MSTTKAIDRTPGVYHSGDSISSQTVEERPKQNIDGGGEEFQIPMTPDGSLQRWNDSRINIYRYLGANFSFIIMGMNDAAYGVGASLHVWELLQRLFILTTL